MPAIVPPNRLYLGIYLRWSSTAERPIGSIVPRQASTSTLTALPTATTATARPINTAIQKPSQEVGGGVIVGCVSIFFLALILCCCCCHRRDKRLKSWSPPSSVSFAHAPLVRSHHSDRSRKQTKERAQPRRPVLARVRRPDDSEDILAMIKPPPVKRPQRYQSEDGGYSINPVDVPRGGFNLSISQLWPQPAPREE
ncbi:hypothetical protein CC80DRAFT_534813 [Byssothecium circinans]|uniref:Uncharacterized protein n=1 Tax=Byssothecium circinans TaxID=147558 RepID=A0A6A5TXL3_9PLEO|nr:hypothetical protein CC80DRAFT_534813 [Byssothecium circinans]